LFIVAFNSFFLGGWIWNSATNRFAETSLWKRRILWPWGRSELEEYQGYMYVCKLS